MKNNQLKALRNANGWTQEDMADLIGEPKRTYASWERGERDMPNEMLVKLADLLKVSTDCILGRTNIPANYGTHEIESAVVPFPETLAAHETEDTEEVSDERMKEIVKEAYRLIMAKEKQRQGG